jgi:hypothetical protein
VIESPRKAIDSPVLTRISPAASSGLRTSVREVNNKGRIRMGRKAQAGWSGKAIAGGGKILRVFVFRALP